MTCGCVSGVPEGRLIALHGPGSVAGGRKCTHVWGAYIGCTGASSLHGSISSVIPGTGRTARCRTLPFGQQHMQQPRTVPRAQGFQQA